MVAVSASARPMGLGARVDQLIRVNDPGTGPGGGGGGGGVGCGAISIAERIGFSSTLMKPRSSEPPVTVRLKLREIAALPPPLAAMSKLLRTVRPSAVTLNFRLPAVVY